MTNRRRRHIIDVMALLLICGFIAAFLIFTALDYGQLQKDTTVLREGWSVVDLDARPMDKLRKAGEPLVMVIALGDEFAAPRSICFYSVFQSVEVRLDGVGIYRFEKPRSQRIMQAAPSYWNVFSVPAGSAGKLLTIKLVTPYQQYANVMPEIRSGSAAQIRRYVNFNTLPRFVIALAILCVGLIFAFVAVVMRYYVVGSTGLYALSISIVMLAIFLATQQTTILLEVSSEVSYILFQNVALLLCPILYARYLVRVNEGIYERIAEMLFWLSEIYAAAILLLQLTGVREMPQMMGLTECLWALVIIYALFLELRRKRLVQVVLFALMMIYVAVRYYFTDTISWLVYGVLFAYLYIQLYRIMSTFVKSQAKEIRLEAALEVSKSEIATIQITSHFFYHTLDSIRALIRIDSDRAYKMTGDFAKYIRHRVDGVERLQETVPFTRELRSIRAYTDIKQAQLGERFEMIYEIETEDFEILPLTVQPLVENAVIHAVQRRTEGGVVRLSCVETDDGYHIEVIDNGPGPNPAPEVSGPHKGSTALQNVNTRLEFYGIAPVKLEENEFGGMTASLDTPKMITKKEAAQ